MRRQTLRSRTRNPIRIPMAMPAERVVETEWVMMTMMHEHAMVMMTMSVTMRAMRAMRVMTVMRALARFFGARGAAVLDTASATLAIAHQ